MVTIDDMKVIVANLQHANCCRGRARGSETAPTALAVAARFTGDRGRFRRIENPDDFAQWMSHLAVSLRYGEIT